MNFTRCILVIMLCAFNGLVGIQPQAQLLSINSIEKQLAALEREKAESGKIPSEAAELAARSAELKVLRAQLAQTTGTEHEFLNKKISLITQDYQILSEIEHARQQYNILLEEHLKQLYEYKSDPDFSKLSIQVKAFYSFDEFEEFGRRLLSIKTRLADLEKSRIAAYDDAHKRKRARAMLEEDYQEKTRQQEEFVRAQSLGGMSHEQQGELIDLQKRLIADKKILAEAKVKEAEQRIGFLDTNIMIVRAQLAKIRASYDTIKRSLYVDDASVRKAEAELERKRNEAASVREQLTGEIRAIDFTKSEIRKKAAETAEKLGLAAPEFTAVSDWEKTPRSMQEWTALCTLGYTGLEEAVVDVERENKEAKIELEKAKLRQEEIQTSIIRSWHTLTTRRLGFSANVLEQQVKSYETPKAEIQSDLALLTEKRTRALSLLQELNTMLDRIKKLSDSLKNIQEDFKDHGEQYATCVQRMHDAEEQIRRRMYLTAKLIEVYSTSIAVLEDTIKRIDNVILEVGTKSFWRRSSLSITWPELTNFFPDIKRFIEDIWTGLVTYWRTMSLIPLYQWMAKYQHPSLLLLLVLRILIALLVFWILRIYLPELRDYLARAPGGYFMRSSVRLLGSFINGFVNEHLISIYLWFILYALVYYEVITNVYLAALFYLASIPYMLYIAYRFLAELMVANDRLNQPFVSDSYKSRFLLVIPPFVYITIMLFFFRQAFITGNYHASAVPAILLAINYIALQLALMSLISKEWILSLIPRTTPLWEWVYDHVSHYYYFLWLLLITIIVMANPYVGYGKQVLFVLSRLIIIALLIPVLSYIYTRIRRVSADLFFYYGDGEKVLERFNAARTWYGFFVVAIFCAFTLLGIILGAKVLGYAFGIGDILGWLHYELYSPGADEMGRRLSVTPLAFLRVILFFITGLVIAYIVNNILLRRIFDPLLVSSGIQNTVFTFTRYAVIFIALLVGFKSVGLQSFASQFVLLLGALGFAVKDPLLDFFSYFIILVQRPIKIGDLIMLDENTTGVVRHITPRSVVLRRKNSVTIIVPNAQIITRPVINWSYSPTFFALNDIMLTVPYGADPDQVRALITKVLDANINVLKTPVPLVFLWDFVDNGFQFMIRAYLTGDKVLEQWEIASVVRLEIVRALRQAGIRVAVPTRIIKLNQQETNSQKAPPF